MTGYSILLQENVNVQTHYQFQCIFHQKVTWAYGVEKASYLASKNPTKDEMSGRTNLICIRDNLVVRLGFVKQWEKEMGRRIYKRLDIVGI